MESTGSSDLMDSFSDDITPPVSHVEEIQVVRPAKQVFLRVSENPAEPDSQVLEGVIHFLVLFFFFSPSFYNPWNLRQKRVLLHNRKK